MRLVELGHTMPNFIIDSEWDEVTSSSFIVECSRCHAWFLSDDVTFIIDEYTEPQEEVCLSCQKS